MTGQKILVLGATGLIGLPVAARLAGENEVHGLSRASDEDAVRELEARGVKVLRRDAVEDGVDDLDPDYDYIFDEVLMPPHLCAQDADRAFETHAFLNARLIEKFAGCKGIVLGSTGSVYRPSAEPVTEESPLGCNPFPDLENYVLSKICGDKMADYFSRKFEARVAVLRYYHPYDTAPGSRVGSVVRRVQRGEPIKAGSSLSNPMFVGDVAELTIRAAEVCQTPPEVINVGGEQIVSGRELAEMVGEALGKEPVLTESADSASNSWVCSSEKRIELLGREAVSLRDGIAKTIAVCVSAQ